MKKIIASIVAVALTVLGLGSVATAVPAYASGKDNASSYLDSANDGNNKDLMGTVKVIINVVLGLIGVVAVVMIIIGGIGFTTSQGDAAKVTKAKNTVLYGVIGLVVALLAYAIVNFVLTNALGS